MPRPSTSRSTATTTKRPNTQETENDHEDDVVRADRALGYRRRRRLGQRAGCQDLLRAGRPQPLLNVQILKKRRMIMKTMLSALIALSVIAGVAGSASALDAKTFYEQVDRNHY